MRKVISLSSHISHNSQRNSNNSKGCNNSGSYSWYSDSVRVVIINTPLLQIKEDIVVIVR